MDNKLPMSFTQACKDFFGLKPQQTLPEFVQEMKALSQADKDDLKVGLVANGYVLH